MTQKSDRVVFARKAGVPEQGYWLDFAAHNPSAVHDFCGDHTIAGAECPYCAKPFLRILSLVSTDKNLELDAAKVPAVHLLYCWTCSIPHGEFAYRVMQTGGIEILQVPPIYRYAFGVEGPYEGYTGKFPHRRVALSAIATSDQENLRDAALRHSEPKGNLANLRHQIGGYPYILNPSPVCCISCSREIPLLAAICDDASGNRPEETPTEHSFTGNGSMQMIFHYCRDCSVVVAYHSTE